MRKVLVAAVVVVTTWVGSAPATAVAQFAPAPYGPSSTRTVDAYNGPTLSPWLNMLRSGSPSANYYLGVIPEFQRRYFENLALNNFQALDRRTAQNQEAIEEALARQPIIPRLQPTGHPTGFLNYGPYFGSLNKR